MGGGGFQSPDRTEVNEAGKMGMSLPEYQEFKKNQARTKAELESVRAGRAQDLAEGRKRGEELFGQGSLSNIEGRRAKEIADVIKQRQEAAKGYTSEEQNALRSQAIQNIQGATQGQLRNLRAVQGRSGIRGGLAAAQQAQALQQGQQAVAGTEQNLFLQNLANRQAAMDALEKSIQAARAEELGALKGEKLGQLSTELGFGSLGAAERGSVMQKLVGEEQAKAAARSGGGGKK